MSDRALAAVVVLLVVLVVVVARLLWAASSPRTAPPRLTAAAGLVAIGGVWMLVNKPVEGRVLLDFGDRHGLTMADLPSIVLFLAAVVTALLPRRRPGR